MFKRKNRRAKILVLGADTLLGKDVLEVCSAAEDFTVTSMNGDDVVIGNWRELQWALPNNSLFINCLYFGDIEEAEQNEKEFMKNIMETTRFLANACSFRDCSLFHFSSHHIFDGEKGKHYTERDLPHPISIYGNGMTMAEKNVRMEGGAPLIIRVQSLFGTGGDNFVNDVVEQLRNGAEEIHAVGDQVTAPTYTVHVAEALMHLIRAGKTGVVNVASSGECSEYGLAKAIVDRVKPGVPVVMSSSVEMGYKAKRPKYGVLDNYWYTSWTGKEMPGWEDGLDQYLTKLGC
jgi:dTDP-4-dehydrorhamnose reductase